MPSRFKIVALGWASASVFFTAVLEVSNLGHKPLGFALYANAVHFALWTVALPLLAKCARHFPLKQQRIRNAGIRLVLIGALAMVVAFAHWAIIFPTYFPYRSYYPSFQVVLRSEPVRFFQYDVLIGIVLVIAVEAWQVLLELQAERMRAMDLERQLAISRMEALRMQLHPHFLFNALHTAASLTVEDPPTARRMVIALGDLLRNTLKDSGTSMRTLAEELDFSDLYLGIEKLRLGERLVLNYEIDPETARAEVPTLLLQPLFENAIRHGAARVVGSCEVRFRSSREAGHLHLTICNDGPARVLSPAPSGFGVGLTNTMNRLRLHYGDDFTLQFRDRPQGGAQIDISIPYTRTGENGAEDFASKPISGNSEAYRANLAYIGSSTANGNFQKR